MHQVLGLINCLPTWLGKRIGERNQVLDFQPLSLNTIHHNPNVTSYPKFPSPPVKGERGQEEKEGIQRKVRK